jgi:EAL domain-containing protein (putative c-di-GMP-specific phosphodiesterase class I)
MSSDVASDGTIDLGVVRDASTEAARVLLIDDDASILRYLERVLRRAGFDVTSTQSGQAALHAIAHGSFDVILSDVHIADTSGVEVLRAARKCDPDLPVIMMTGAPAIQTAIHAVEFGAFRYLVKPFEIDDLMTVVRSAVTMHRSSAKKRTIVAKYELDELSNRILGENFARAVETMFIAYQPIVRWSSRSLFAYEALLRTQDRSLPSPAAVLGAAEKLGLLTDLGRRIRAAVVPDHAHNPAGAVFVNLHATDLVDDNLFDALAPLSSIAKEVVLEVTERVALHDVQNVHSRISDLRKLGFRIAIDDLGEGYAGLSSLVTLEPEVVKLDMSLVRGVERSPLNRRLIRAMVELSEETGCALIAEGVETIAERDALVGLGCDLFQGFLFARPDRTFPAVAW